MLERPDDLLLHRQPAGDHVEFDPALEGKAVDDLPMVETGTGPAPRAAPDLYRGRLSPGARRNLTGQTIEMPLGLAPAPIAFASGLKRRMSIMTHPPGFASQ